MTCEMFVAWSLINFTAGAVMLLADWISDRSQRRASR